MSEYTFLWPFCKIFPSASELKFLERIRKKISVKLSLFCSLILDMPLIGSLIRILQYMEGCGKRSVDNSKESEQEETGKAELKEEDFHLKILKDICCELLSNMFQELTKVRII